MALTKTTIAVAIGPSDTLVTLTSGTGWPAVGVVAGNGLPVQIDGENSYLVAMVSATTARLRMRGSEGTEARSHDVLAPICYGTSGADFPPVPVGTSGQRPPQVDNYVAIGQNTNPIILPDKNTEYVIVKGSALATTVLPAPTVAQNGLKLTFTSQTAFAHVITATALLNNGLTGSPFTTATFAAFAGAGFTIIANNGLWNVVAAPVSGSTVVLT